jgi:serine/threonine protein kinase
LHHQLQVSRAGLEGTVEYCAPEVLRGESYSETCDVWSFGVVLWELLTRQRPYSDSDIPIFLMVVNIGNGGLTLPPVDPEQATPGLVELLGTCLRFEPGDRPSFQEVLKVLEGEYRILRSRPGAVPGGWTAAVRVVVEGRGLESNGPGL